MILSLIEAVKNRLFLWFSKNVTVVKDFVTNRVDNLPIVSYHKAGI